MPPPSFCRILYRRRQACAAPRQTALVNGREVQLACFQFSPSSENDLLTVIIFFSLVQHAQQFWDLVDSYSPRQQILLFALDTLRSSKVPRDLNRGSFSRGQFPIENLKLISVCQLVATVEL